MPEDPNGEQPDSTGASDAADERERQGTTPPGSGADEESRFSEDDGIGCCSDTYSDPYSDTEYAYPIGGPGSDDQEAAPTPLTVDQPKEKAVVKAGSSGGSTPPPVSSAKSSGDGDEPEEDDGMLRMSFLEHLEELRQRIINMLGGLAVAFILSLFFTNDLWKIVQRPAARALTSLGFDPYLIITSPMEGFMIVWVKLPVLTAIFIASPWILYQVWAFVAPGLYKRERRWATPFILSSAGLFILGGLFAYFIAFRFGLTFLLGIGKDIGIRPLVTITEYFDLFVNVTLGIAVIFELPVLIFFLTLLRIVSPSFLIRHSRYAILIIVILAAVITPTPDAINLSIFAIPMILLYFLGVFASYLLTLHREGKRFPWKWVIPVFLLVAGLFGGIVYLVVVRFGYHIQSSWPFLVR